MAGQIGNVTIRYISYSPINTVSDYYNVMNVLTVEIADRDSMLNKIVWANRIVRFRARLYYCGDPLYKGGGGVM